MQRSAVRGSVEFGARKIEDDLLGLGVDFSFDGAVGMKKLAGNKRENGGAAWRDAAFGDLGEKARQEQANVFGGGEVGRFGRRSAERSSKSLGAGVAKALATRACKTWREQRPACATRRRQRRPLG